MRAIAELFLRESFASIASRTHASFIAHSEIQMTLAPRVGLAGLADHVGTERRSSMPAAMACAVSPRAKLSPAAFPFF
jgi:hypothetical protein